MVASMIKLQGFGWLSVGVLLLGLTNPVSAADVLANQVTSLIVKFKPNTTMTNSGMKTRAAAVTWRLSAQTAAHLTYQRPMAGDAHLIQLPNAMTLADAQAFAKTVAQQPDVAYAVPDRVLHPMLVPNDRYFASYQWNLQSAKQNAGAINALGAWDQTTGSSNIVVAVLDTGIASDHEEFSGRFATDSLEHIGIDMISDPALAADGNARDWSPYDSAGDWHGTHVAGILGATGNNNVGVAGVNWQARILPVRVLGAEGGMLSDIIDGLHWAVGDPAVPIVVGSGDYGYIPENTRPAKVVNMSLGGTGVCSAAEQEAIDYALSKGVSVVVSAGNDGQNMDVTPYSPATCEGVITVAAVTPAGQKASFSNYGSDVMLAAPGTTVDASVGIASTVGPASNYENGDYSGTSMAAPHVTGVISLMLGINPNLTPTQVKQLLTASVRPHVDTVWGNNLGAGLLDACRAVKLTSGQSMSDCDATSSGGGSDDSSGGGGSVEWLTLVLLGYGVVRRRMRAVWLLCGVGISLTACHAATPEQPPISGELATAGKPTTVQNHSQQPITTQLILKLKPGVDGKPLPLTAAVLQSLSMTAGVTLAYVRPLSGEAHVLRVVTAIAPQDMPQIAEKLNQHPSVQYAEPDSIMKTQ